MSNGAISVLCVWEIYAIHALGGAAHRPLALTVSLAPVWMSSFVRVQVGMDSSILSRIQGDVEGLVKNNTVPGSTYHHPPCTAPQCTCPLEFREGVLTSYPRSLSIQAASCW